MERELYMRKIRIGALLLAVSMLIQTGLPVMASEQIAQGAVEEQVQTEDTQAARNQTSTITAKVPSATPSYYLTLPDSIALGDLDVTRDYNQDYTVGVQVDQPGNLKLKITSDRKIIYKNKEDQVRTLTGYNTFGTQYFTEDGTAAGTLTVYKEDIGKVPKGEYTGTLQFYTSFVTGTDETEIPDSGDTGNTDTSGTVKDTGGETPKPSETTKIVRAHVLMEEKGQIKPTREDSMCWPFFYQNAELNLRNDGSVDVTLYMIDPIPGSTFMKYGTPLEHFYVTGSAADITVDDFYATPGNPDSKVTLKPTDDSYGAEVTIDSTHQVNRQFVQDKSGGVFVPSDGNYPSDPVRFTVPLSAIKNSASGSILLTAYVKPMTVWKQFFLVLDDVEDFGNSKNDSADNYKVEKSEIPSAGVNGLKDYAETDKNSNYTIYIRNADGQRDAAGIAGIASLLAAGRVSGTTSYYDISLERQNGTEKTMISDTDNHVLEIRLPLDVSKGKTLSVYRSHDGKAGLMQSLTARMTTGYMDNTYYADWTSGYLYIYTSRFSVYGVQQSSTGVDNSGTNTGTNTDSNSDSNNSNSATHADGNYTASVSMRKNDNISAVSMCAPLFYSKADLKVSGSNTKVTLYVIDPIPKYASEGTPLSNAKVTANGKSYSAAINSGSKVSRYFEASEQFIPNAGNYYATPVTFTIPTTAVEKSSDGKVKLSAYVNAVMKSTQEFYVVFSNWKSGETESSGKAAEITADTAQTADTGSSISLTETTSGTVKDGEYLVPVTAYKEKTNELSMMADYMYPKATMVVSGNTTKLTIYVQHTVAGIEGGGPEWISYNGTKVSKVTNAAEFGGVSYDSFTFTLSGQIPSPMLVSMYINAMKMEVKARLVFDFNNKSTVSGQTLESALEETAEDLEEETMPDLEEQISSGTDMNRTENKDHESEPRYEGYRLVTDATLLGVVFLVITVLAGAGTALWWYKKRR